MTGFVVVPNGNIIYARPDYVDDPLLPSTDARRQPRQALPGPRARGQPGDRAGQPHRRPQRRPEQPPRTSSTSTRPTTATATASSTARPSTRPSSSRPKGPVVVVALPGDPAARPDHRRGHAEDLRPPGPGRLRTRRSTTAAPRSRSTPPGLPAGLDPEAPERLALRPEPGQRAPGPGRRQPEPDRSPSPRTPTTRSAATPTATAATRRPRRRLGRHRLPQLQRPRRRDRTSAAATFPVDGILKGPNGDGGRSRAPTTRCRSSTSPTSATPAAPVPDDPAAPATTRSPCTTAGRRSPTRSSARHRRRHGSLQAAHLRRPRLVPRGRHRPRPADPPRRPSLSNSLNGILVRPDSSGRRPADRRHALPRQPARRSAGRRTTPSTTPALHPDLVDVGWSSATAADPQATPGRSRRHDGPVLNRLYIQPGMMIKFAARGRASRSSTPGASLNVGDRTYINGFDAAATLDPTTGLPTSTYGPNSTPELPAEHDRRRPGPLHLALRQHGHDLLLRPDHQAEHDDRRRRSTRPNTDRPATTPPADARHTSRRWPAGAASRSTRAPSPSSTRPTFRYGGGSVNVAGRHDHPRRPRPSRRPPAGSSASIHATTAPDRRDTHGRHPAS